MPDDPAAGIFELIGGRCPACFLDNDTDEDAFRSLPGRGLGILVAETPRPTPPTARLTGPEQVRRLLCMLVDQAERGALPRLGTGCRRTVETAGGLL